MLVFLHLFLIHCVIQIEVEKPVLPNRSFYVIKLRPIFEHLGAKMVIDCLDFLLNPFFARIEVLVVYHCNSLEYKIVQLYDEILVRLPAHIKVSDQLACQSLHQVFLLLRDG